MRILNFFMAAVIFLLGGCAVNPQYMSESSLASAPRTVVKELLSHPYKCDLVQYEPSKKFGIVQSGMAIEFDQNVVSVSDVVWAREDDTTYLMLYTKDKNGKRDNYVLIITGNDVMTLYKLGSSLTWPFGYKYRKPYMYISQWEPYGNTVYLWKATPDSCKGPEKISKGRWNNM